MTPTTSEAVEPLGSRLHTRARQAPASESFFHIICQVHGCERVADIRIELTPDLVELFCARHAMQYRRDFAALHFKGELA